MMRVNSTLGYLAILTSLLAAIFIWPGKSASGDTYIYKHLAEITSLKHSVDVVYFPYEIGEMLRRQQARMRSIHGDQGDDIGDMVSKKTGALLRAKNISLDAHSPLGFFIVFTFDVVRCDEGVKVVILVRARLDERIYLDRNVLGNRETMTQSTWSTVSMVEADETDLYEVIEEEAISATERFITEVEQAKHFYLVEKPKSQ